MSSPAFPVLLERVGGEIGATKSSVLRPTPFDIGETWPPAPFHGEFSVGSAIPAREQTPTVLIARNTASAPILNRSLAAEGAREAARIVRDQRLRDMLASIEEFWRSSGPDRTYWRRDARHRLAEWRRLYRQPERAAFQAAVAAAQHRRTA